jgi:RHS repeat-associated protein
MGIVTTDLDGLVTRSVGYAYDVDDQRVSKTVDGVVENYYLDGNQIAFVTDGGGNETEHYLYGLNVDQVLAADSATGMLWALADRLGSIDTLTDADGNVLDERTFDSFGRLLSESNPSVSFRYGYTGRELDLESGLDYYRARYYDAAVGRFVSVDPMGFGAGDTNLYRYVGNNATNATDPTGMWSLQEAWNGAQQAWNNGVRNVQQTFNNTTQTVQDLAYNGLVSADRFVAGLGSFATGGNSDRWREYGYGDRIAGQSDSFEYALGQSVGFGITSVLGALLAPKFASSFLTKKILAGTATSVGGGIASDLIFPGLLQSPIGKNDKATLPEGYELTKAAFEFGLGFGLDKGAKLAEGLDDLITVGGRKLGNLLDGVPVLVDGFENFARNPTSLGDLFKPGLQSASTAINNAGSWFQHYFASNNQPLANQAEEAVSRALGIPRNRQGSNAQTVPAVTPSKDNAKTRVPELIFRDINSPQGRVEGSIRQVGAIIEVKATNNVGGKFGSLPDRGRKQILDYVAQVEKYRAKANLIKDPILREKIANAKVIVYTDLNEPVSGKFADLIAAKKLEIKPIPKN